MKAVLTAKVGMFLVLFSVLAVWTLLAARPVFAQRAPTAPSCPSSSTIRNFPDDDSSTEGEFKGGITISTFSAASMSGQIVLDDPNTTDVDEEVDVNYFRITVPTLTVGELTVEEMAGTRTVGRLCRGSSTVATHPNTASGPDDTDEPNFEVMMEPVTPGEYFVVVTGQDVNKAGERQADRAEGKVTLSVTFSGVRPKTLGTSDKGSFGTDNELHSYALITSNPGLLTVETTGNTGTVGTLLDKNDALIATADEGGAGNNFEIVSPVPADDVTVTVQGQSATERGDYTLEVDFKIAAETLSDLMSSSDEGPNADKSYNIEDGTEYFYFTSGTNTFLTVETKSVDTADTNTAGTLFGEKGEIAKDTASSGDGDNFRIHTPVSSGNYIVQVDRKSSSTGKYVLMLSSPASSDVGSVDIFPPSSPQTRKMEAPSASEPVDVHYYSINVPTAGTLQVQTVDVDKNVPPDTTGVLYGPDGKQLTRDEDSGDGTHFKITQSVEAGQHVVAVAAASRTTGGDYQLKVAFIEGTTLGSGSADRVVELEARVAELEADLEDCPAAVVTDATGALGNPPDGGFRSGVGLISGWVCAANEVEVRIFDNRGVLEEIFAVAYGTSRPDTVGHCSHDSPNTGFGMTYNFNHLDEGTYTIRAYADREQIGSPQTFEVVHLTSFEATDTDRFLRLDDEVKARGECIVPDFPTIGERTFLLWEESIQNFVIEDAG